MRFEPLLGHQGILAGLWQASAKNRLPHALLFVGPSGVGKFLAAETLTLGLACQDGPGPPCGVCGPCKRLRSGSHPDVFVLDPALLGEEEIKVAHVAPREEKTPNVGDFLSLLPMEGRHRVVLIREAERLNPNAQNALLKTLEEPGSKTHLVLETAQPERLLATIHSRCMRVGFGPLAREEVLAILEEQGLEPGEAGTLARWSRGAPGAALEMRRRAAGPMRALLTELGSGQLDTWQASARLFEMKGDFGSGTARAQTRERARALLDLSADVLADMLHAAAGVPTAHLAHGDLWDGLARRGRRSTRDWGQLVDAGLSARQDVDANLPPEAALEPFFAALAAPRETSARS